MIPETIGHYRITAPIGAGGMGEVYRARDTKLDRDVAIKILPPAFASDADRMARFEREAKVLASLNHPNIAQIHGVEDRALIMELVEGESPKGPMPFDDAWKIAMQMADALEYAHEKGVVHRDLKPANVKVTPDGVVKLLDFGLAKAFSDTPESPASDAVNSPTLTMNATVAGVILGTAAYMAPEQAKGKRVDKRADIWSWGVVLYELLTGDRLFKGDDAADTLAQVLTKEPDLDRVPPNVRKLLRRCLEKDPKNRVRDISVAKELLEQKARTETRATSNLPWIAAGVLLVVSAALGVALWRATRPVAHPLARLDVDLGSDITLNDLTPAGSNVILSPDGTRLVYSASAGAGRRRLFTRRLDQPKAAELPGTEGADNAFFSPDGQWVGFYANGRVSKISVEGGASVALANTGGTYAGADWGEDGTIVVGEAFSNGLIRVPSGGGKETPLLGLSQGEIALGWPQILPGAKALLFGHVPAIIEVLTFADHRRKTVARGVHPRYLPVSDHLGYLVYNIQTTLFAVPFDIDKLETRGTPVPVLDDVAYTTESGGAQFDYSASGTLVYRRATSGGSGLATIQWVDAAGVRQPLQEKPGAYRYLRLSPDGKRAAFAEGLMPDIWVYDSERGGSIRLTFGGGPNMNPVWSPDGRYVVFASPDGISWTRSDGAGQPQPLIQTQPNLGPGSFTPEGNRLAYSEVAALPQIWTVPVEENGEGLKAGKPEQFLKEQFADANPVFSPDGHWLAYESNTSGTMEVYVRPFPPSPTGQGGQWQVSDIGAATPVTLAWSRTGHELYYQSRDQIFAVSYSVNGNTFIPEKPRVWISKVGGTEWDLAPDGKRIAVVTPVGSGESPAQDHTVVFLQNFLDYLKKQVPLKR
jgi:Tol biopolymer transport system component